jgi:hypothetical protein
VNEPEYWPMPQAPDDTDDAALELNGVAALATAVVGNKTFLFAASAVDDGVSVFEVAGNGSLTNVDNVTDDATLELDGASAVHAAKLPAPPICSWQARMTMASAFLPSQPMAA